MVLMCRPLQSISSVLIPKSLRRFRVSLTKLRNRKLQQLVAKLHLQYLKRHLRFLNSIKHLCLRIRLLLMRWMLLRISDLRIRLRIWSIWPGQLPPLTSQWTWRRKIHLSKTSVLSMRSSREVLFYWSKMSCLRMEARSSNSNLTNFHPENAVNLKTMSRNASQPILRRRKESLPISQEDRLKNNSSNLKWLDSLLLLLPLHSQCSSR